jgi:hypothetical protein
VSGDSRFTLIPRPVLHSPSPGHATIALVREQFARAKPMDAKKLFLDGAPLGMLAQKSVLIFEVGPGTHAVEASSETVPLPFETVAGETRLFRLREVINERDIVETSWIEDDPLAFDALVSKHDLKEIRLTHQGREDLEDRLDKLDQAPTVELEWLEDAVAAGRVVFTDILFDRTFRKDDVSRSFTEKAGTLTLTRTGLEWNREGGERFVLPWSRVSRIRFAGSRFYEENPWVGFLHIGRDGSTMSAAFTDQREPYMARTYARIFAVSRRLWRDAKIAERHDDEL